MGWPTATFSIQILFRPLCHLRNLHLKIWLHLGLLVRKYYSILKKKYHGSICQKKFECFFRKVDGDWKSFVKTWKLYEFFSNIISGLDWRPPITASAGVPFPTQPPLRPLAFLASPPPLPATISSNNNQQLMELIGALRERSSPTPTEGNAILFWITHPAR